MSIPRMPGGHDDACVWWDNVGKEPLDYACTCGVSHLAMLAHKAVAAAAVEALREIVEDQYTIDYRKSLHERAKEALRLIEQSGWVP